MAYHALPADQYALGTVQMHASEAVRIAEVLKIVGFEADPANRGLVEEMRRLLEDAIAALPADQVSAIEVHTTIHMDGYAVARAVASASV